MKLLRRRQRRRLPAQAAAQEAGATPEPCPEPVDGYGVLAKVTQLPISTWRYHWEAPDVRHLGPMAQDWKAAFGLGQDDTSIPFVDANGVAMVSIQALHRLLTDLQAQVDQLRQSQATAPGS